MSVYGDWSIRQLGDIVKIANHVKLYLSSNEKCAPNGVEIILGVNQK